MNKKQIMRAYVLDAISSDGYNIVADTDEEKVRFLASCFVGEYLFEANLVRYGTKLNVLREWIAGAPTLLNISLYNGEIILSGKKLGLLSADASDAAEYLFVKNWFALVANTLWSLFAEYGVRIEIKSRKTSSIVKDMMEDIKTIKGV